jgi:hypothetical protein
MLLRQFQVKGYKNLNQLITFGPLGRINVIHGSNNVGKSNLLQAIDLFFRLLSQMPRNPRITSNTINLAPTELETWGYLMENIFNLVELAPIELVGEFEFTAKERGQFGLKPSQAEIQIGIQLYLKATNSIEIRFTHLTKDITTEVINRIFFGFGIGSELLKTRIFSGQFALLGINRRVISENNISSGLHVVPQQLRDALFDAKESREVEMVRRWSLFVEAMQEFENILGPGRFDTAFDRQNNQADLVFDAETMRVPVDLLGSGVQQVVALLGQLLLTPAALVGIEEPELNLRYTLQKQLLAAFQKITQSEYGPQQLFLTSHSPAFEAEETFFAMEIKDGVPSLSQKPRELARLYTGTRDEEDQYVQTYSQQPEPPSYVSSEGLVMLPEKVRQELNLEQGGGISFLPNKETGRFEIWTTGELDTWLTGSSKDANDAG